MSVVLISEKKVHFNTKTQPLVANIVPDFPLITFLGDRIMGYKYDKSGLEDQISDHIYQLMERFAVTQLEIREMVAEILANFEPDLV